MCVCASPPGRVCCRDDRAACCRDDRASGSQGVVLHGAAGTSAVAELLQVGHSVEVDERSGHNQDVEQLVGVELERGRRGGQRLAWVLDRCWTGSGH